MHFVHPQQDTSTSAKEMIVKDGRMGSKNRFCAGYNGAKNDFSSSVLWCKSLRGTFEDTFEQARPALAKQIAKTPYPPDQSGSRDL
jgi:hypothetical protein